MKPQASTPLVLLHPVGSWSAGQDATVGYSPAPEFPSSAWDWIGLYKVTLPQRCSFRKGPSLGFAEACGRQIMLISFDLVGPFLAHLSRVL